MPLPFGGTKGQIMRARRIPRIKIFHGISVRLYRMALAAVLCADDMWDIETEQRYLALKGIKCVVEHDLIVAVLRRCRAAQPRKLKEDATQLCLPIDMNEFAE